MMCAPRSMQYWSSYERGAVRVTRRHPTPAHRVAWLRQQGMELSAQAWDLPGGAT